MASKNHSKKASTPRSTEADHTDDLDLGTPTEATGTPNAPASPAPPKAGNSEADLPYAAGHEVYLLSVSALTPNPSRKPLANEVEAMAKSIQSGGGLLCPIVVGSDMVVIAGNKRLAAYAMLGKKEIPSRFIADADGHPIASGAMGSMVATIVENAQRSDPSLMEQACTIKLALESGYFADAKTLARAIGLNASTISVVTTIAAKASPQILGAIKDGVLTVVNGQKIVARCPDHASQDQTLHNLIAAAAGKTITAADVDAVAPRTTNRGRPVGAKTGMGQSVRSVIPADALNAEKSAASAALVKLPGRDNYRLELTISIDCSGMLSAARFNVITRAQGLLNRIDEATARQAIEEARVKLSK